MSQSEIAITISFVWSRIDYIILIVHAVHSFCALQHCTATTVSVIGKETYQINTLKIKVVTLNIDQQSPWSPGLYTIWKTSSGQLLGKEMATHWDLLTSPSLRKRTLFRWLRKVSKGGEVWCIWSVAPDEMLSCLNTELMNQTMFL